MNGSSCTISLLDAQIALYLEAFTKHGTSITNPGVEWLEFKFGSIYVRKKLKAGGSLLTDSNSFGK
jgi:hypothetical protein